MLKAVLISALVLSVAATIEMPQKGEGFVEIDLSTITDMPVHYLILNQIHNRCNNYMFKCNQEKLKEYTKIINDYMAYFIRWSSHVNPLSLNARYMAISSLVKNAFHPLGFVGFYLVELIGHEERLEIGPYASNITATPIIALGKGVCGESWQRRETMIVGDVTQHPNYIACDEVTMSEIVVPHFQNGKVRSVFDIDAEVKQYFDETDKICLEEILQLMNI